MRAILCTLLKVERCVIVPRRAVVALEGRTGRAEDGRLEAPIVVRGPVEDAAEELGAGEARRDGREGRRFCDDGGVVDHAPETIARNDAATAKAMCGASSSVSPGRTSVGTGPGPRAAASLASASSCDVDGVEHVDQRRRPAAASRRAPRRLLVESAPAAASAGGAPRMGCSTSAAQRRRRRRVAVVGASVVAALLSVTALVGGRHAPQFEPLSHAASSIRYLVPSKVPYT